MNMSPEKGPFQQEKESPKHHFSGAKMLAFGIILTLSRAATYPSFNMSKNSHNSVHIIKKIRQLAINLRKPSAFVSLDSQPSEFIRGKPHGAAGSGTRAGARGLSGTDLDVGHVERRTAAWVDFWGGFKLGKKILGNLS